MAKHRDYRGAILLLILYALLPVTFSGLYMAGNIYSLVSIFEVYNLSIIAGAVAYVTFMAQFFLSARIRLLERIIAQDKLLALHGLAGLITAGLVLAHLVLKYLLIIRYGGITPQSALGIGAVVIYAVLTPAALLILRKRRAARRGGSPPYRRALTGHNLFALAGALAAAHVLLASSTWSPALRIFTILWGASALAAYVYHKLLRPRRRIRFVLESVSEAAGGVYRYEFAAEPSCPPLQRRAGQFGYWAAGGEPRGARPSSESAAGLTGEEHPFTVASPPGENPVLVVRASGDYTSAMPRMRPGTRVYFDGPYGHFTPAGLPEGTPLLLLAGGIGITPFLSITADVRLRRMYPMALLWSVHRREECAVAPELAESAGSVDSASSGELSVKILCSSEEGRAGLKDVEDMLNAAGGQRPHVFICGPSGFTEAMRAHLRALRVARCRIHSELFGW